MCRHHLILGLFLAIVPIANAQPASQPKPSAPGQALFDGKTLNGWKKTNFGGEGDVVVEGGAIVMDRGDDMTGITYAGKPLPKINYELTLEAKRVRGGDFFATTTFPVGNSHCSLVLGGWGGTVVGLSSINGRDASQNKTERLVPFKNGQWYAVRIRVTKDQIQAWIDKKRVVDVNTKGKKISVRAECLACTPLGVATWRTTGAVRNIRVRALTAARIESPKGQRKVSRPSNLVFPLRLFCISPILRYHLILLPFETSGTKSS